MLVPDGGALYVMGGVDATGQVTDTVDVYDEDAGWQAGESRAVGLSVGVVGASGTLDATNSGIILVGGFSAPAGVFPGPWTDGGGTTELYQSAQAPSYTFAPGNMPPSFPAVAFGVVMSGISITVLFDGLETSGALSPCQLFDPKTTMEIWRTGICTAPPTTPRWGASSAPVNFHQNVFDLIGGFDANGTTLGTYEQYNFSNTSNPAVATGAFLTVPRGGLAVVVAGPMVSPSIWAIGGTINDGSVSNTVEVGGLLQTSQLTPQASGLNVPRTYLGAAVLGTKIIVLGGLGPDGGVIGQVEIFDQNTPDAGWMLQCPDGGV